MVCALMMLVSLVFLGGCRGSKEVIGSEEAIKVAQNSELKGYQGEADSFTERILGGENVIATIGIAPKGNQGMVGVVNIPNVSVKIALWGSKINPEIGMSVRVTCIYYSDPRLSNGRRHQEACIAIPVPL
ncbi:MAG: hypothetical protein WC823_01830 [Parcubacteria group bacterium]